MLVTNQSQDDVLEYFSNLAEPDFARTGGTATETIVLKEGPLTMFSHSMEPQLRQIGLPVQLVKGVVTLLTDHTVCNEGDVLSSEQARVLKLLGHQQAEFKLNIVSGWNKEGGKFTVFKEIENKGGSGGEAEDSDDNDTNSRDIKV